MNDRELFFSPDQWGSLYRSIGIILLWLLWMNTDSSLAGLFFILFIVIMMLLRWRFDSLKWTLVIDQIVCIITVMYWPNAVFGLIFSTFDSFFMFYPITSLFGILYALLYVKNNTISILLLQSIFAGFFLWKWKKQRQDDHIKMDLESKKRHEVEILKNDLIYVNVQVARAAEIAERDRIAREIHDNTAHEIIAAYMSLQVVDTLLEETSQETREMFQESIRRLENGIEHMRNSVHNLAPRTKIGISHWKELCEEFIFCPITMKIYGDTSIVPVYLWSILEPCLKEAFANIMRHSKAEHVWVTLDITPYIVRLCVDNDGVKGKKEAIGIGLRNLRHRALAVGGNVSTDMTDKFRLICVLPIE